MPNEEQIQRYRNPFPTVDVIIEYNDGKKSGIVLIERRNPPYGIAIPGGFAEYGLSLEENVIKEAKEETGLEVVIETPEQPLCVHSMPDRDPRGHMVSISYITRGYGKLEKGNFDDAKDPTLYSVPEILELIKERKLAFDHDKILMKYLRHRGYVR
jgi:ADP-ribose pyrophosphatase YjhB (NUDIX family)